MDWDELMIKLEGLRYSCEEEAAKRIATAESKDEAYISYLMVLDENEVVMEFIKKVQTMDEKLDKILERLG